jgi:hypothetical protein
LPAPAVGIAQSNRVEHDLIVSGTSFCSLLVTHNRNIVPQSGVGVPQTSTRAARTGDGAREEARVVGSVLGSVGRGVNEGRVVRGHG